MTEQEIKSYLEEWSKKHQDHSDSATENVVRIYYQGAADAYQALLNKIKE